MRRRRNVARGAVETRDRAEDEPGARALLALESGGGAGTRTPDTEIMILLLYQLSYNARIGGHP